MIYDADRCREAAAMLTVTAHELPIPTAAAVLRNMAGELRDAAELSEQHGGSIQAIGSLVEGMFVFYSVHEDDRVGWFKVVAVGKSRAVLKLYDDDYPADFIWYNRHFQGSPVVASVENPDE